MPQITALKTQKKDPGRVSLYLDGRFVFGLSRSLVSQAKLVIGQEISTQIVVDLRDQSEDEKILNFLLDIILAIKREDKNLLKKVESEIEDYLILIQHDSSRNQEKFIC